MPRPYIASTDNRSTGRNYDGVNFGALLGIQHGRITTEPSILDLADTISSGAIASWPPLFDAACRDGAVRHAIRTAARLSPEPDFRCFAAGWRLIAQRLDAGDVAAARVVLNALIESANQE